MSRLSLLALALLALLSPVRAEPPAPDVVILAVDFVLAGRLESLRESAEAAGVSVHWHHVETMDEARVRSELSQARLILLDAPRGNDIGRMREMTGPLLGPVQTPQLLIGAGRAQARGLSDEHAQTIADFYSNPLPSNRDGLWRYVASVILGRETGPIPDPVALPERAIAHPALPNLVETDPAAYRQWLEERDGQSGQVPTIAFAISSSQLDSDQSAILEAMIAAVESRGGRAWPFYHAWTDPYGMRALLAIDGIAQVDVVINLTHMLGVEARQTELQALDVPLLQGFAFRDGTIDEWRGDPHGVPMRALPGFVAIPEQMGAQDPLVIGAQEQGRMLPIPEQVDALVERSLRLAALRHRQPEDTRIAILYWSYPPGERGVSASKLNVPRSLVGVMDSLRGAGYQVSETDQESLEVTLPALLDPWREGLTPEWFEQQAANTLTLPLASYNHWLSTLPPEVRERLESHWGQPDADPMVMDGKFHIPALTLGNVVLLPQPSRGGANLHTGAQPPPHGYFAAYLAVRTALEADALVHFGTHGSQEFLAGKERGLSAHDDALLVLGDLPVIYPYISDNIAEGLQAKRRGRAVTITHQPPPFSPAGFHGEILQLHDLIHDWEMLDEGPVRTRTEAEAVDIALSLNIHRDLDWTAEAMRDDFAGFEADLHDYLHELAADTQPLGLHSFGQAPAQEHRVLTVMQMLGDRLYEALAIEEPEELFSQAHDAWDQTEPYQFLARFLIQGEDSAQLDDPDLRGLVDEARDWFDDLAAPQEMTQLLRALRGGYIATTPGGDTIRNPAILPTGRNLFGFDPSRLPTQRAWEVGRELADELLESHAQITGNLPRSLAMSLWSSEAMRHQGVLEAQALALMGLEPEWDAGGRVTGLRIIDSDELGRPRVDIVFSLTGVYRDQFPQFINHLAEATLALSLREEAGNAIADNSRALRQQLAEAGINGDRGAALAAIRVFTNAAGDYGTGLTDSTLDTEGWDEESQLADIFLSRMQTGYGAGQTLQGVVVDELNLFAMNLAGVEGAVLARSSNLNGLLSTDHPFEYLGGLSLAVRQLSGRSPSLYISNLRDPAGGRMEPAARSLAGELRSRYQHPGWIAAMQNEGYAGTLELLNVVNNTFGWQVMDTAMVRDDQWQSFHDIYVTDSLDLGLREWFEAHNPDALRRIVERMLETAWRGYWEASDATLESLVETQRELAGGELPGGELGAFIEELAGGFGLAAPGSVNVSGQMLQAVPEAPALPPVANLWLLALLLLLITPTLAGAWRQVRLAQREIPTP